MDKAYKPQGYNSVSPYFIVDGADKLIDILMQIFDAELLRKFEFPDGTILHAEIRIDDSVLMFGNSSDAVRQNKLSTHIYVPNVDAIFRKAINSGCEIVESPKEREGDPEKRGSFRDFAGNIWSIATHIGDPEE